MNKTMLLMVALKSEEVVLKTMMKIKQRHIFNGVVLHVGSIQGKECLLLRSGIGPERSLMAMEWILSHYEFEEAIFTGFGGGLDPKLKRGTALIAEQIHFDFDDKKSSLNCHEELNQKIVNKLNDSTCIYQLGTLLTVSNPLLSTLEKQNAFQKWQAHIVDMESYPALALLQKREIPFTAIRFVLDENKDSLIDFEGMMTDSGEVNPGGLLKKMIQKPQQLLHFPKLGMYAAETSRHLKNFFLQYFNLNKS